MRRSFRSIAAALLLALTPAVALAQALPSPRVITKTANDNSTSAASTAYVDASAQLLLNALAGKAPLANPTFTGTPAVPTANADTATTQAASTAFVLGQAAAVPPIADGTAAAGTSLRYSRADHVHPTDLTRAPLASPTFTGTLTAPATALGNVSVNGLQNLNVDALENPVGVTKASGILNATKSDNDKFEIGHIYNCSTAKGAQWIATQQSYLGSMVCGAFGVKISPGSGGGYGATFVMGIDAGVATATPATAYEVDVNKRNGHCGDTDSPVAGGTLIPPCFAGYYLGGGTGRLTAILGFDMGGSDSNGGIGLPTNRGLVFYNGTIRRGVIEDFTTSAQTIRVGGTKTSTVLDTADAVIATGFAAIFGKSHVLGWRNAASTNNLPLISKDSADALALGNGNAVKVAPGGGANLRIKLPVNVANAVTLVSSNDSDNALQPIEVQTSKFVVNGGPIVLPSYTVGSLPTCNAATGGGMARVSDASGTITYRGALTGGGSTSVPVYCDGTAWSAH